MNLGILVGLLVTWWIGWCVVMLWLSGTQQGLSSLLLRICLAFGIGTGLTSCTTFAWLLVHGRMDRTLPALELGVAAVLTFAVRRRTKRMRSIFSTRKPFSRREGVLGVLFVLMLLGTVVSHFQMADKSPHGGGFDAFATWNLRARFLFRGGVDWPLGFSNAIAWSHPDYPLLIPITVARLWCFAGWDLTSGPCWVASGFTLATIGLLVAGVALLRGREQGMLAGIALMATPFFISHGASQFADIPLSFFIMASLLLIMLQESQSASAKRWMLGAGVMAGCAAWTKNEGLAFAAVVPVAMVLSDVRRSGIQVSFRQMAPLLAGLALVLGVAIVFKASIAPPNDIVAGQASGSTLQRLMDFSRYTKIARWFAERAFLFDNRGFLHILPVLAAYFLLVGADPVRIHQNNLPVGVFILAGTLAAYALAYLTTPHDLEWHLKTSLDRLILQLWPVFLLIFFTAIRTPGELAALSANGVANKRSA